MATFALFGDSYICKLENFCNGNLKVIRSLSLSFALSLRVSISTEFVICLDVRCVMKHYQSVQTIQRAALRHYRISLIKIRKKKSCGSNDTYIFDIRYSKKH